MGYVNMLGVAYESPTVATGYGMYIAQVSSYVVNMWLDLQRGVLQLRYMHLFFDFKDIYLSLYQIYSFKIWWQYFPIIALLWQKISV